MPEQIAIIASPALTRIGDDASRGTMRRGFAQKSRVRRQGSLRSSRKRLYGGNCVSRDFGHGRASFARLMWPERIIWDLLRMEAGKLAAIQPPDAYAARVFQGLSCAAGAGLAAGAGWRACWAGADFTAVSPGLW